MKDLERGGRMASSATIPEQQARPHPVGVDDHGGRLDAAEQAERADHMEQSEQPGQQAHQHDAPAPEHQVQDQQHAHEPHPQDRSGARAMFYELRKLPDGSPSVRNCATPSSVCTSRSSSIWPGASATVASRWTI